MDKIWWQRNGKYIALFLLGLVMGGVVIALFPITQITITALLGGKLDQGDRPTTITAMATIFGVIAAIFAGVYAGWQLRTARAVARWDFIMRFDERFRSPEHLCVYRKILEKKDWPG